MKRLETPSEDVQVQVLPLIDVIFCILTFFILAALQLTRQQSAISVDLPQAKTGAPQSRDMVIVSMDNLGQLYVDKDPITRTQLSQLLVGYRQQNPDGLIVLYAPKTTLYNEVVQVLDLLRSVGGDRVALATLPETDASGIPGAAPTPGLPAPGLPSGQPNPTSTFDPGRPIPPGVQLPGGLSNPVPGTAPGTGTGLPPGISGQPGATPTTPAPTTSPAPGAIPGAALP